MLEKVRRDRDFLRCVEDTAWDFADECFRNRHTKPTKCDVPVLTHCGAMAEKGGCADAMGEQQGQAHSMLLIGLPGTGKTTLLQIWHEQLASGKQAVSVVLQMNAASWRPVWTVVPQLDVGEQTDALDPLPKGRGYGMAFCGGVSAGACHR